MTPGGNSNNNGIITDPSEILEELYASKEAGNILGIWSASKFGNELVMCRVKSIHDDRSMKDKAIIIREVHPKKTTPNTYLLYLMEIEKVHQFRPANS